MTKNISPRLLQSAIHSGHALPLTIMTMTVRMSASRISNATIS
ncbi:MAG TPA: hypothetical protein VIH66_01170 [Gammaproteobacteria bacterium]